MSLWGLITASPKAVEKVVDGVYNGVDKAIYTDEERAEVRKGIRDWSLKYLEKTQGMNLARRLIALIVTGLWASIILLVSGLSLLGSGESADFLLGLLADEVTPPFMMIMAFYFASHIVSKIRNEK